MKKLITISLLLFVSSTLSLTASASTLVLPWEAEDKTTIKRDKHGGYSSTQRNYKSRKRRSEKSKQGAGYEGGTYKAKSSKYKKHEWQFIDED